MKTAKIALATLFLAAAGAASAAAPGEHATVPTVTVNAFAYPNSGEAYQGYTVAVSTKTRAQVKEELYAARRNGQIFDGETYPGPIAAASTKTRTEVVAELSAYRAAHPDIGADGALAQLR